MSDNPKTKLDSLANLRLPPASSFSQSNRPNLKALVSRPEVSISEATATEPKPVTPVAEPEKQITQNASEPKTPDDAKPLHQEEKQSVKQFAAPLKKARTQAVHNRFPITYAFTKENLAIAEKLASVIGCRVSDIVLRIAKEYDAANLDPSVKEIEPRAGRGHIVHFRVDVEQILAVRSLHDPLGIKKDGYLLRAPIVSQLDKIANTVLNELKEQFNV